MEFSDALTNAGEFGLYQLLSFIVVNIFISIMQAMDIYSYVFFYGRPDHWCKVKRLSNFSHEQQKYISIPSSGDYDNCRVFDLPFDNFTDAQLEAWDRSEWNSTQTVECSDWVYDQSLYTRSYRAQYNLVCDMEWAVPLIYSVASLVGIVTSLILSALSDRYGRTRLLVIYSLLQYIFYILRPFSPNFLTWLVIRVFIRFFDPYLAGYVLLLELSGTKYRSYISVGIMLPWSVGVMLTPLPAYFIRDAFKLSLALALPCGLCISFIWLLYESPRWLAATGKVDEATKILQNIGAINGRTLHRDFSISAVAEKEQTQIEQTFRSTLDEMAHSKHLITRLLIVYFCWMTVSFIYSGLSVNLDILPASLYLSTFLTGAVEIPGNLLALFLLDRFGRKYTLSCSYFICGISLLLTLFILDNEDLSWLNTTLFMIGKMFITAAFTSVYQFSTELFPTPVRQFILGSAATCASLGSVIAPFMGNVLMQLWKPMPSIVFGSSALLATFLCLYLPETLNKDLPDTTSQAKAMSRTTGNLANNSTYQVEAVEATSIRMKSRDDDINKFYKM